jgi:thymidylate synthase
VIDGSTLAGVAGVSVIEGETLGDAWLAVSHAIFEQGSDARYDGLATKELAHVTVVVAAPDPDDALIAELGDPAWSDWMRRNFTDPARVPELGDAASYATRLYDWEGTGRDQVAWVVERLRADPESRSAAITTFQPSDTTYVPCVSMLDFWRPDGGAVELVVYAHSLDFGKKAYGNLVELAQLQRVVADGVGAAVGRLVLHAKSAHVYEPEWEPMRAVAYRERTKQPT